MSANQTAGFLGVGWAFPSAFDKFHHDAETTAGVENIEQSIRIILSTMPGERVMRPNFGCDISTFMFSKGDTTTQGMLGDAIRKALLDYEPRIIVESIGTNLSDILNGKAVISIEYTVTATNVRRNMVYPYYLIEATNVIS